MHDDRIDTLLRKKDAHYRKMRREGVDTSFKHRISLMLTDLEMSRMEAMTKRYKVTQSELIRLAIHFLGIQANPQP